MSDAEPTAAAPSAPAPAPAPAFADAVRVPIELKQGRFQADRIDAVLAVAEPLMGRKPTDPHAFVRHQPNDKLFVSPSSADTLYFPKQHPLQGLPRYRWVDRGDGVELGYLVPEKEDA